MTWHLLVTTRNGEVILLDAWTRDFDELAAAVREVRRLYPETEIWVRSPIGAVYRWD